MANISFLNKAFIFSLAVVFLLAMHFPMQNPGGAALSLSFNVTTWMALSFSFGLGFYKISSHREIIYSKLTLGLFICVVLLTIPTIYDNANLSNVDDRMIGLWAGFIFFVILQQFKFSEQQKYQLLWLILLAVVIEALFGFWQYLMLEPGNMFVYNTVVNRPYGIFQQPNIMASFLATGLVLSGFLITTLSSKPQAIVSKLTLLFVIPLLTVPLLIALASRTGWLGAIIAIACVLPFLYHFSTKKRFFGWFAAILIGIVIGLFMIQSQGTDDIILKKADVESPRTYIIPQAFDMIVEKPLAGYGYGKFEYEYINYTAKRHQQDVNYKPGLPMMDHPHNELLFWAVEGGVIPLIGILLAALFVALHILKAKAGKRLAIFALFIPIGLHTQLEYPFYHSAIHWIIFLILIYWIDQEVSTYGSKQFSGLSKTLLRVASVIVPVLVSFYMITALHTNVVLIEYELSRPKNPDILKRVSNHTVWKARFERDVYNTYFDFGLVTENPDLLRQYVSWATGRLKERPQPSMYKRLIIVYQALNEHDNSDKTIAEANFYFPDMSFSDIHYHRASAASSAQASESSALNENKEQ